MGFSLGTGVASYVSENRDFSQLVLIAPYSSMVDVINTRFPIAYGPMKHFIKNQYMTKDRVENMNEDTLIIASNDDEIINIKISKKLIALLPDAEVHILNTYSHNQLGNNTETETLVENFLTKE